MSWGWFGLEVRFLWEGSFYRRLSLRTSGLASSFFLRTEGNLLGFAILKMLFGSGFLYRTSALLFQTPSSVAFIASHIALLTMAKKMPAATDIRFTLASCHSYPPVDGSQPRCISLPMAIERPLIPLEQVVG